MSELNDITDLEHPRQVPAVLPPPPQVQGASVFLLARARQVVPKQQCRPITGRWANVQLLERLKYVAQR